VNPNELTRADPLGSLVALHERLKGGALGDIEESLAIACAMLEMEFGIVSRIEGERYLVEYLHAPPESLERGAEFVLGQTYCAMTLKADDVVAIDQMSTSPHCEHPAFEAFRLESYIGAPLFVDGERYGTVNFSRLEPNDRPWTESDRQLIRLLARLIGGALERQRLGEALSRSLRGLRRTNEILSKFAGRVSHDLRAPLQGIEALLYLLESELPEEAQANAARLVGRVRTRAGQMNELIEGLLAWSRGGWGEAPETIDLAALVARSVDAAALPEGFEVSVSLEVDALYTAAVPLEQVLRNLISNAAKHHDRERGRIDVSVTREGRFALFKVADDGPGISAEHHQRVFTPFRTLKAGSTGLGLAMVKEHVELHGGEVTLESEGRGTTFLFRWPLRTESLR